MILQERVNKQRLFCIIAIIITRVTYLPLYASHLAYHPLFHNGPEREEAEWTNRYRRGNWQLTDPVLETLIVFMIRSYF